MGNNCKYCGILEDNEMICANAESDYYADFVEEEHSCENWEEN